MAPLSVTVPMVVLAAPAVPARMALALPLCRSYVAELVSVAVALLTVIVPPPCKETVATESEDPPRFNVPLLTVTLPPSASTLLAPSVKVPALTVVPPV